VDETVAVPAIVVAVVGVALTVTVALAALARFPRSHVNCVPVPHEPCVGVMLLTMREESRLRAKVAFSAWFGPWLLTVATKEIGVPVVAAVGAVREIERSAGDEEMSFTSGPWKINSSLVEE
jgi:hypothetical protein